MIQRSRNSHSYLYACAGLLFASSFSQGQIPDFTLPEVAQKVDRKNSTYNLGPTGLRGFIHVSRRPNDGADGTMTGESRQILITVVSAPADQVLKVDDVILGVALGKGNQAVPTFQDDARKTFGQAIGEAEKKQKGVILRVKRWRAGSRSGFSQPWNRMGKAYSCTNFLVGRPS